MRKLFILALFVIGYIAPSFAGSIPTLDFAIPSTSTAGEVSYAGGANPLVGLGIPIASITGTNTALNNGLTVPMVQGELEFITGNLSSSTSSSWTFSSGSFLGVAILGCANIDGDIDTTCDSQDLNGSIFGSALAVGIFTGSPTVTMSGSDFSISGAVGIDFKDPALLAFYGAPNAIYSFNLKYDFTSSGTPPGAFSSTAGGSGDFINEGPVLPEPASLALLGTGLLGLAGLRRKIARR